METKTYSPVYRIMHWAIAICMILSLITIFLRMTWLNKNHVADIIQDYLSTKDTALSREEMVALAKKIRKPMWEWHIYLGYLLSGLIFIRLTLPFFGSMKFANPLDKQLSATVKFRYWAYAVFYAGVVISLVTGLIIELGPKSMKDSMEEIHILSLYYLIPYLILHLGGVLWAEFGTQPGIISRIVSGKRDK